MRSVGLGILLRLHGISTLMDIYSVMHFVVIHKE